MGRVCSPGRDETWRDAVYRDGDLLLATSAAAAAAAAA